MRGHRQRINHYVVLEKSSQGGSLSWVLFRWCEVTKDVFTKCLPVVEIFPVFEQSVRATLTHLDENNVVLPGRWESYTALNTQPVNSHWNISPLAFKRKILWCHQLPASSKNSPFLLALWQKKQSLCSERVESAMWLHTPAKQEWLSAETLWMWKIINSKRKRHQMEHDAPRFYTAIKSWS